MFNIIMQSNDQFEDLYEVLEVHMGSTKKEILQQYKSKIEPYNLIIKNGKNLNTEELWEVKLLKIAKYVLTNPELREKYNVSRIINTTEEEENSQLLENDSKFNYEEEINTKDNQEHNKFLEYGNNNIPLRKDQGINHEQLTDRQFERFDHENFDLTKDRMLRTSNEY